MAFGVIDDDDDDDDTMQNMFESKEKEYGEDGIITIGMHLCSLPSNISSIVIQIKLECLQLSLSWSVVRKFDYNNRFRNINDTDISLKDLHKINKNKLTLKCHIIVIEAFDQNGEEISLIQKQQETKNRLNNINNSTPITTGNYKFVPKIDSIDLNQRLHFQHFCISKNNKFEEISQEELRLEDIKKTPFLISCNQWNNNNNNNNSNRTVNKKIGTKNHKFKPYKELNSKSNKTYYFQHIAVGRDENIFINKCQEEIQFEDKYNDIASRGKDVSINDKTVSRLKKLRNITYNRSSPKGISTKKVWSFSSGMVSNDNHNDNDNNNDNNNDGDGFNGWSFGGNTNNEKQQKTMNIQNKNKSLDEMIKNLQIGDTVKINGNRKGHIKYIGDVGQQTDMIGIELDRNSYSFDTKDNNDGSFRGVRYFNAAPKRGLFVKKTMIIDVIPLMMGKDKGNDLKDKIESTSWSWNLKGDGNNNNNKDEKSEQIKDKIESENGIHDEMKRLKMKVDGLMVKMEKMTNLMEILCLKKDGKNKDDDDDENDDDDDDDDGNEEKKDDDDDDDDNDDLEENETQKLLKELRESKVNELNDLNEKILSKKDEMKYWFENKVCLMEYYDLFLENGFNDLSVIREINMEHLKEIGVKKLGHRIKILQEIAKLSSILNL